MTYKTTIPTVLILFLVITAACCSAKQAYVQPGDVVLWGNKVVDQNSPDYVWQMRLAYLQAAGKAAGVYDSIDPNLKTWDNTRWPIGITCFWEHIDLVVQAGPYEYDTDYLVILRPTPLLLSLMDIQAVINKKMEVEAWGVKGAKTSFGYSQPELFVLSKWWLTGALPWMTYQTKEHWSEIYGIDYNHEVDLKAAQWSPCVGQPCHYDFTYYLFWWRDVDCSSLTWYYLWWGYYVKSDPNYGNWLVDHPDWIDASDSIAPGQVADYLISHGFATVIYNIPPPVRSGWFGMSR